jgi:hypothetical protein
MAIGNLPTTGFQPVDNDWLNGFAGGHNNIFQNGLTAVGTNQATSLQLADRISILEIDTSAASTGVALPFALSGMVITLINNTANNITVFPAIANNSLGAQDTINNTTSVTLNAHTAQGFTSGKTGVWYTN